MKVTQETKREEKAWRKIKYSKKFLNAIRGINVFLATSDKRDLMIYAGTIVAVVFFGFYLKVSHLEWVALIFSIGFVIVAEVVNTAIEIDIDLTSPEFHPYARDTKDVAAAAVLLSVFMAIIIGFIIFVPKLLGML